MSDDAGPWAPVGIETSQQFREYVTDLRATALPEPNSNHGLSTDIRRSKPMSTTEQSLDDEDDLTTNTPNPDYGRALARLDGQGFFWLDACEFAPQATTGEMGRRAFMVATAVAAASVAGVGTAAANPEHGLNYDSKLVPDVHIPVTATIGESQSDMGPLEYIDDDDSVTSLAEYGGTVAPGPENNEDVPEAHNWLGFSADHIEADIYSEFPAGETFVPASSDDGEEEDLSALDQRHWVSDADMGVTDSESPGRGMGVNFAATGVATGAEATAQFTDVNRDSGIDRTYLQIGYTVNSMDPAATVYVRVRNTATGNTREVMIQDGGDTSTAAVIGTGNETAAIRQVELGNLAGTLETIDEVEVAIADADADLDLFAFAVERPDRWEFGDEEYVDQDDELDTQTIYEPTGLTWISSYESLPSTIKNSRIFDIQTEAELRASELPAENVDVMFEDAARYSEDQRFHLVQNIELPVAFDLELDVGEVTDVQRYQTSKYNTAEILIGDQDPVNMDSLEDHEADFTDRASAYNQGLDEEVSLSSLASQGDMVTAHYDLLVSDGQADSIQDVDSGNGGAFGMGREGSGVLNAIISLPGMVATALLTYGGYALARSRGVIGGVRG